MGGGGGLLQNLTAKGVGGGLVREGGLIERRGGLSRAFTVSSIKSKTNKSLQGKWSCKLYSETTYISEGVFFYYKSYKIPLITVKHMNKFCKPENLRQCIRILFRKISNEIYHKEITTMMFWGDF